MNIPSKYSNWYPKVTKAQYNPIMYSPTLAMGMLPRSNSGLPKVGSPEWAPRSGLPKHTYATLRRTRPSRTVAETIMREALEKQNRITHCVAQNSASTKLILYPQDHGKMPAPSYNLTEFNVITPLHLKT